MAIDHINCSTNTTTQTNKGSANNMAVNAGIVGAGIGTACGVIKKVPIANADGKINDSFVKKVYNKYLNKTTDEELKRFETQRVALTEKIKDIKNSKELKKLIDENEEFVNNILDSSGKKTKFLAKFSLVPVKMRKKNLINAVDKAYQTKLDGISDAVTKCLNGTTCSLTKADGVSDELYKSIRNIKWRMKAKQIGKGACVGGILAVIATFLTKKFIDFKKNQPKDNKNNGLTFKDKFFNKTC